MAHELNEYDNPHLYQIGPGTNVCGVYPLHDKVKGTQRRKGKKRKRSGGYVHTTIGGKGCVARLRG